MKLKHPNIANAINTSVFLPALALALDLKLTLKFPKKDLRVRQLGALAGFDV